MDGPLKPVDTLFTRKDLVKTQQVPWEGPHCNYNVHGYYHVGLPGHGCALFETIIF